MEGDDDKWIVDDFGRLIQRYSQKLVRWRMVRTVDHSVFEIQTPLHVTISGMTWSSRQVWDSATKKADLLLASNLSDQADRTNSSFQI